jgi:hypothetical protein
MKVSSPSSKIKEFREMKEIWKPIPDHPGYEASNLGRIRSHRRGKTTILKPWARSTGHLMVNPSVNGKNMSRYVHRLVMLAFVGPCPEGMEVCHGPGGPGDNRPSNLRYDTHKANIEEAAISGTMSLGTTVQQALEIRKLRGEGLTLKEIATKCNVTWWTAQNICSGKTHKYLKGLTLSPFEINRTRARQIREEFATGQKSMDELSEEHGLKRGTIRDIIRGRIQIKAGGPIKGKDYQVDNERIVVNWKTILQGQPRDNDMANCEACQNKPHAWGLCRKHYTRLRARARKQTGPKAMQQ